MTPAKQLGLFYCGPRSIAYAGHGDHSKAHLIEVWFHADRHGRHLCDFDFVTTTYGTNVSLSLSTG